MYPLEVGGLDCIVQENTDKACPTWDGQSCRKEKHKDQMLLSQPVVWTLQIFSFNRAYREKRPE